MQHDHDDHGGLHRDMPQLLGRRAALRWIGGVSLGGLLAACGVAADADATAATTSTAAPAGTTATSAVPEATTTSAAAVTTTEATTGATTTTALADLIGAEIPDEAAGPFPADGTNGPNVLTIDGVLKADLTTSFGERSGVAAGVPTTLQLRIVDAETGEPADGAVVYLWHCTADGRYSIYEIEDQNYLRGVQVADAGGRIEFQTVYPGCYPGRWPHAHFEVYRSLDEASVGSTAIKTSQLALPEADAVVVYDDPAYGSSLQNLAELSLSTDGVFRDGWSEQLATVTGSPTQGYTASLLVRV